MPEFSKQSTRNESLDVMKGIGIFLVCLGHCIPKTEYPLNRFLLSFHMPLFFFAAGMTAGRCIGTPPITFLQKKLLRLLPAHLTLTVLSYLSAILISCVLLHKKSLAEIPIPGLLDGWFIPTLFFCNILMYGIVRLPSKFYYLENLGLLLCIGVLFCFFAPGGGTEQTICAMIFCLLGYMLEPFSTKYNEHPWAGFGWIGYVVVAVLCYYNAPIGMFINRYGCKTLFIVTAILGILSTWEISSSMKNARFLSWIGRYSLVIYVTHMAMLPLIHRMVRWGITGTLDNHGAFPNFFITFLVLAVAEAFVLPLCIRYCPFLFGMQKERSRVS